MSDLQRYKILCKSVKDIVFFIQKRVELLSLDNPFLSPALYMHIAQPTFEEKRNLG